MGQVRLEDLTKKYSAGETGEVVAVDAANLEIADGEMVVLVGPSGSGKSTLLRCIAGLEEATSGEIYINNEGITHQKPRDRDIAMVFQNYALYPHLTAEGNMSFGLKMRGNLNKDEIKERVKEAAEMMGIEELLSDYPRELSGGQQQRVSLGRAIVRDPAVFLMDEPLSNLDAKLRTKMRTELQRLQNDLEVTTIYVTHDQTEAMTMGDRIVIMDKGTIQQVATPLEAYYQPKNLFVAGFIGSPSMNFIDVSLAEQRDNLVLESDSISYLLSSLDPDIPDDTEELVLGIRPEDIQLCEEGVENSIPIEVDVVEPLGKEQFIYFEIDNKEIIASVPGSGTIREGTKVSITFADEDIHLFDKATGEAVVNPSIPEESEQVNLLST